MHYYQHHIGDFIKDTARLSDGQAMAYLRLIWRYYDQEAPIADEVDVIAFQLGASESDVSLILRSFFKLEADGWHQTRCDSEIQNYRDYLNKQSENGKKGGRPRKDKPTENPPESDGLTTDNPTNTQTKANTNPTESQKKPNHKPLTNNQGIGSADAYKPRRRSRIPEGYSPKESHIAKAREKGLSLSDELESFTNFHTGKGSVMADWDAAFHTWLGNASRFGGKKPQQSQQTFLGETL